MNFLKYYNIKVFQQKKNTKHSFFLQLWQKQLSATSIAKTTVKSCNFFKRILRAKKEKCSPRISSSLEARCRPCTGGGFSFSTNHRWSGNRNPEPMTCLLTLELVMWTPSLRRRTAGRRTVPPPQVFSPKKWP